MVISQLYSKGIPGSRTIFGKKNHPLRRIFWICLTIVCCFLAFYQVSVMAVLFSLWSIISSLALFFCGDFFSDMYELLTDDSFIPISFGLWLMLCDQNIANTSGERVYHQIRVGERHRGGADY
jgi:hypothetical protein